MEMFIKGSCDSFLGTFRTFLSCPSLSGEPHRPWEFVAVIPAREISHWRGAGGSSGSLGPQGVPTHGFVA